MGGRLRHNELSFSYRRLVNLQDAATAKQKLAPLRWQAVISIILQWIVMHEIRLRTAF